MPVLQIIAIIFAIALVYSALIHYRRGELNTSEIVSWVLIWTGVLIVVIFPDLLREFTQTFLFTRLFDLVVVGGFVVVFSVAVKAYFSSKESEKRLEDLVRKISFKDVKKKS